MIDIKERLRAFDSFAVNPQICKEAADHLEQQEAEIARLRKDAERYQFLRKVGCDSWMYEAVGYKVSPSSSFVSTNLGGRGLVLDHAIDAVLAKSATDASTQEENK